MVYKKAIGMSKQLFQTWKTRSFMNATLAILLDQTMNAHPLNLTQCLIVLTDSSGGSFHWWKTFYHIPQGSSTPGKTILTWTPVNVLAICTGSNHRLTYWAYCSGISCWLAQLGCLFTHETCSTTDYKVPQHLEKQFHHECQSTFWPFLRDQTMNRDFLSQVQWHRVLTVSTCTPFTPENSAFPGSTSLVDHSSALLVSSEVLKICTL